MSEANLDSLVNETAEEKTFFSSIEVVEDTTAAEPEPSAKSDEPVQDKPAEEGDKPAPKAEERKAQPQKQRKVNLGALHQERSKRREAEAQLRAISERLDALEKNPPKALPDPAVDPEGYNKAKLENTERELAIERDRAKKITDSQRLNEQRNRALDRYRESAQSLIEEQPDFMDWVNESVKIRAEELKHFGHNPEAIQDIIYNEEAFFAAKALSEGKDPAREVYRLLKIRHPGLDRIFKERKMGNEKLDTLEKGQAASKTVSNKGGAANTSDLTIDKLAGMSGEKFDKAFEQMYPDKKRPVF